MIVVLARVEADADARPGAAGAAAALLGRGLGDGRLDERGGEGRRVVVVDLGEAGVDHERHPVDGDRRLRDVGGDDHLALAGIRLENALLLLARKPGVEGEDLEVGRYLREQERARRVLDRLFAGEEDEDVALALGLDPALGGAGHRLDEQVVIALGLDRQVPDVDRVHGRVNVDDRAAVEVDREAFRVDGGRGDDDLEVGALLEHALQKPEDEVDVEAALVRLVHHDHAVGGEVVVGLDLLEERAVGHDLDPGGGVGAVEEAHLVADRVRHLLAELPGDVLGDRDRGDAARLGDADDALLGVAGVVEDLRDLGGLARPGRALHHDHLVFCEGVEDLVLLPVDGKIGVIHV
jgi:hypothetical protein